MDLSHATEQFTSETRADLLRKMESLFVRWRHYAAGWDVTMGSREERTEGFEQALELLSECYEELQD